MLALLFHFAMDGWVNRRNIALSRRMTARSAMLREIMREPVSAMVRASPRDTNRFANANVQAAQEAGIGPLPARIMPLQRSKYIEQQEAAIERQVDGFKRLVVIWRKRVAIYQNAQSTYGPSIHLPTKNGTADALSIGERLREAQTKLNKALKNVDRAQREAEKFHSAPYAIVIGTFAPRRGRAIGTQVISKVYGGEGWLRNTGDASVVELRNREPHARILESRLGWAKKAKADVRKAGAKVQGRTYAELLWLA